MRQRKPVKPKRPQFNDIVRLPLNDIYGFHKVIFTPDNNMFRFTVRNQWII